MKGDDLCVTLKETTFIHEKSKLIPRRTLTVEDLSTIPVSTQPLQPPISKPYTPTDR